MRQSIKNLARESRRQDFFWRYGFNLMPLVKYRLAAKNGICRKVEQIVEDLNHDGIAVTTFDDLIGDENLFAELETETGKLIAARSRELQELRRAANEEKIGSKTFNVELLGSEVDFNPEIVFARLALNETFLAVAREYFGMLVKMRYYNVWQTFASNAAPRESQLWHYDREDKLILKVFLYLKDIDLGAGPFTYAPRTHQKGALRGRDPEFHLEGKVRRTTDEQMSKIVSAENWVRGTGKKGTLIFADTRGYHKGGEARTSDRLMVTCMYTSPASESKQLLKFPSKLNLNRLSPAQLAALELE